MRGLLLRKEGQEIGLLGMRLQKRKLQGIVLLGQLLLMSMIERSHENSVEETKKQKRKTKGILCLIVKGQTPRPTMVTGS